MSSFIQMKGEKFGRWTVLMRDKESKYSAWICECKCGTIKSVISGNLRRGKSVSCGCHRNEFHSKNNRTHGKSKTDLYKVWRAIRNRCFNSKTKDYKNYGDRGISLCEGWANSFENFYEWSINNGYEKGLTIDRIDNNENYRPTNCRWVERKVQNNNRRNNHFIEIDGVTKTLAEWSECTGINRKTIQSRIAYGWEGKDLILPTKGRGANGTTAR